MYLKNIKLSGFKSFVDPMTITFPSELVGVLGPNGCGKSNIIDAVRWVMGEVSAKQLRGQSMADVIFNGSSARKPAGFASVELTFDNAEGKLGGEYANYSTIALRREVTREGQSTYFLNGTKCRRRDVTNVFLGTGLGPRSYAIIKQDTISRIIEAKPEELRVYIEEAAGISKYKERRRETETRIRHTRENLDRLSDVRSELEKQLEHLQRQAQAAEKYKQYKAELRQYQGEFNALHWRELNAEYLQLQERVQAVETQLQANLADIRRFEAELTTHREQQHEFNDNLSVVQSKYYELGNEVSKLEQSIEHRHERIQQLKNDSLELNQDLETSQTHKEADSRTISEIEAEINALLPEMENAEKAAIETAELLKSVEEALNLWEQELQSIKTIVAESQKTAEIKQSQMRFCETRIRDAEHQIEKRQKELAELDYQDEIAQIETFSEELIGLESEHDEHLKSFVITKSKLQFNREKSRSLTLLLDQTKVKLQQDLGQQVSLQALQQVALGKNDTSVVDWLAENGFDKNPRIAEQIKVSPGWERAIEVVLGTQTQAVCVDDLQSVIQQAANCNVGNISFYQTSEYDSTEVVSQDHLLSKVDAPFSLRALLKNIFVAETLNDAMVMLANLTTKQSVITRDGVWLSNNWIRVKANEEEGTGVLAREQELKVLEVDIAQNENLVRVLDASLEQAHSLEQTLDDSKQSDQQKINQLAERISVVKAKVQVKQARIEQKQNRAVAIEQEISEAQTAIEEAKQAFNEAREMWQQALTESEESTAKFEQINGLGTDKQQAVDMAKQAAKKESDYKHEIQLQNQSLQSRRQATEANLERVVLRVTELSERQARLEAQIEEVNEPIPEMQSSLQGFLNKRLEVETELRKAKQKVEMLEQTIEEIETNKSSTESKTESTRSELDESRMQLKTIEVRRKTVEEQIETEEQDVEALIKELVDGATAGEWQEKIERMERRIQRLGAINLVAIEEFQALQERKTYLDSQDEDLNQALETLESAIRKIDNETRTRFKETLERVDEQFKKLFPRVFTGGTAYLELTEGDLLEAGVLVKAQPPGKRNSSIHMLSGGEKALTAMSLVFAIFQLNPAPFCMLDEVDAPLDDANVGRFCNLVKDLSAKVQFIFITHNKVTMELAQQLIGVTMHEPGVSRLVSVDVEDAVAMAEATV